MQLYYSFYIPKNESLDITEDIFFNDKIAIERKANSEEISGNLTNGRERFKREFDRGDSKIRVLIEDSSYKDIKEKLLGEVKKVFRPEFLNRIDDIIIFNPLSKEDINRIVDIELEPIYKKLSQQGIKLELTGLLSNITVSAPLKPCSSPNFTP